MALRTELLKDELTEKVVRQVHDRLSRDKAENAERFVRLFYANVPPDDILRSSPDQLYGAALAIWQFGSQRRPGTANIRVYTPRVEDHGWQSGHTVAEIVNDDMPFLVDSVTSALNRLGLSVHLVIHPIVRVHRDGDGRLVALVEPAADGADAPPDSAAPLDADGHPESFMHVEFDTQSGAERLHQIHDELARVLADVRASVEDWRAMRAQVAGIAREIETATHPVSAAEQREAIDFLTWLDDDHFTFLGFREYRFAPGPDGEDGEPTLAVVPGSGLGILRDESVLVFDGLRHFAALPPDVRQFLRSPHLLMVTKANRRSTVHRPVHLDSLFVKAFDDAGKVVGERLFVGLFTSSAYTQSPHEIPFLRHKVARVFERAGFAPRSHNGKALLHILEHFPRDELVQIEEGELLDMLLGILHLQERQRVALFVRHDPFERFVSCFVYVPRDRYDTDLRRRLQAILEKAFQGICTTFYTQLDDGVHARVHFIITTGSGRRPEVDLATVEAQLVEATRAWPDRLQAALIEAHGEERGLTLLGRYAGAFPLSYRERFSAEAAVVDIDRVEAALTADTLGMNLYRPLEAAEDELRFKIYHAGSPVPLSDVLPMLEHMDLRVITEVPFELTPTGFDRTAWIQEFETRTRTGLAIDCGLVKDKFQSAFAQVWTGGLEDDGFNRLVLRAGLTWREVAIVRAYAKYLRQIRFPFSQETMEGTLATHPGIARRLVQLFRVRHDPALAGDRAARQAEAFDALTGALDAVANLDEDRILRRFANAIMTTVRTNGFQAGADGQPKPYVSFKIDSRAIEGLPLPRPWREVFVYSPRVEAIHLRGGPVARGGIRWSDRREDFRTEILGLMKAQMVKNAVIVPVGSKGGFVVKRPPPATAGRDALLAEGIECYKTLMRGLLDLTDTLAVDGQVVAPADVVRHDGDDPYLVVAADKGTATFSDIANSVSAEYGFWLGDAFASGGSRGYDHKKMGITARGAWESVKRHFREMGIDTQTQDVTVIGVGDMSGDVFGNGMLLSRHIKLLAAFDHRHIFVDPDPDPAAAWTERRRLFDLPRSSWADYDAARISRGGGVFERTAKSIAISPEMKARFGLAADRLTPADLAQRLLTAEVDLLWFGGIGTFVKSSRESHADVGDKTNDALRVDAGQLRCRVAGEGANLGMTQLGRIEAALRGVRLNTDAIDNSAGVDTSDHEVNIKILLNDVVARGDLTLKQRDELLVRMTDEVAGLVLCDNYLQTQALTVAQGQGIEALEAQARFMRVLEKADRLNRAVERLPDDEAVAARAQTRQGLTRPELAVLMAYAKLTLYDDLLGSDLPDDPKMVEDLIGYFPDPLRRDFREPILRHRLRREIIGTVAANSMVNRVGPTFVKEMIEKTGMGPGEIARAYMVARDAFDLRTLWHGIQALDNQAPAESQTAMLLDTTRLMEQAVAWLLVCGTHPLDIAGETAAYRTGVATLRDHLDRVLGPEEKARLETRAEGLSSQGVPPDLARRVAALPPLAAALDITRIARQTTREVPEVAAVHFALGYRFGLEWLRDQAHKVKAENHWQKQAVAAIVDDLHTLQGQLTRRVLEAGPCSVDDWIASARAAVERVEQLLAELRTVPATDLSMLAVANRQLRGLVAG